VAKEFSGMTGIKKNEIQTRAARIWLDGDGIVRVVNPPGVDETLDDAEANIPAISQVSGNRICEYARGVIQK